MFILFISSFITKDKYNKIYNFFILFKVNINDFNLNNYLYKIIKEVKRILKSLLK